MEHWLILAIQLALLAALILCSAFFSGSEMSLFSLSRARLLSYRGDPNPVKARIAFLMERYSLTLTAIILGNMCVNSGISIVFDEIMDGFHMAPWLSAMISVVVAVVILLFFCEITPMAVAIGNPEKYSALVALPIYCLRSALTPVITVVERISLAVLGLFGTRRTMPLKSEEYASFIEMAQDIGAFSDQESELLKNAFSLRERTVGKIMKGRLDLTPIHTGMSPDEIVLTIRQKCQRYYPVVKKSLDDSEGILSAKSFFFLAKEQRGRWLQSTCVIPAVYIPENAPLIKAFTTLRAKEVPAALVTDEYGGVAGMIDITDIYDEVVGDVEEEYESPGWRVRRAGKHSWKADGQIPLLDLSGIIGVGIAGAESNTLNGIFLEKLGRMPRPGDRLRLGNLEIRAVTVLRNRVGEVELKLINVARQE